MTDLHYKLSAICELENLIVVFPAACDPDVPLGVDGNSVLRVGPFVALSWPTPALDVVPPPVELQHRWRGCSTLILGFHYFARAGYRPHVILRIDGEAAHRSPDPVVGQLLWPRGIHLECRQFTCWHLSASSGQCLLHPS